MLRSLLVVLALTSISCSQNNNGNQTSFKFSQIVSDYKVTDLNGYSCEPVNENVIKHVLSTGVKATQRDIHDYYSTTGCSITGSVKLDNQQRHFEFDYGGILRLDNGLLIGCAENCCNNNFKYCSYEKR